MTSSVESFGPREALEAAGLRCTRQRLAVYGHLLSFEPHHPTADEVYRAVQSEIPKISLATVYKALDALERGGLVSRLTAVDGSARYDGRADRHYHLRCLRTGEVRDLPTDFDPELVERLDPELRERLRSQGFEVTGYRLELLGYFRDGQPRGEEGRGRSG
jgi:Fe2+ or Zn2+ uptake regulation protein